jgi:hypothetical protein
MEDIRIIINQLGPIRNSVLELKPFMVFSGESGLGKSYAAFLVHYLYRLCTGNRLERFFEEKEIDIAALLKGKESGDSILKIDTKELLAWIGKDAIVYIGYLINNNALDGDVEFNIPLGDTLEFFCTKQEQSNGERIVLSLSNHHVDILPNEKEDVGMLVVLVRDFLIDILSDNRALYFQTLILPPSRGSLMEVGSTNSFVSGMYLDFLKDKDRLRRAKPIRYDIPQEIVQSLYAINNGNLFEREGSIQYQTNGVEIPLTAAASSIKELAPLTLYLQKNRIKNTSILFEEPEAHLHPARQIKVADLLGCMLREGCHIQLTTHSDYFLKRLNNLMILFRLKEKDAEAYQAISEEYDVKEYSLIDPASVNAYVMEKGEDGYTQIRKQEITEDGIPYDSFHKVIIDDIKMSQKLRDAFKK